MKLALKVGYWAILLYDLYLFGKLLSDPTMVHLKRYHGISPILRQCQPATAPVFAPTSYPVFTSNLAPDESQPFQYPMTGNYQYHTNHAHTCPNEPTYSKLNFSYLGDSSVITSNRASCFHTQFPAFDMVTNQYKCIVSAKFESVSFDQVKKILSNPSFIFMSDHLRGTDACHWSLNRQRFLFYHVIFIALVLVRMISSRIFRCFHPSSAS